MQLKLTCYKLKTDCYDYKMYYESLMVITKQRPKTDKQMIKKSQSIPLQKIINSQERQQERKMEFSSR